MNLEEVNLQENALILLKGIWYSELPSIIDFDQFSADILNAMEDFIAKSTDCYDFDEDGFVKEYKNISSPPYIRKPGVEGITYYEFKKNNSLREMQLPNLRHYLAFVYNTLLMYDRIFQELYMNSDNKEIVRSSNSYLMFESAFELYSNYDETLEVIEAGIFAEKNNKITGSATLNRNRKLYYNKQNSYLYRMKVDLESFFPNLYTHYFHRIANMEPFASLGFPEKYFAFLDVFHQRINDNQTKGIPAGVFSSHVAAELCMLCVDHRINSLIQDKDISYVRYVDDFTFFSNSQESLEDLKIKLQQILNDFRLRINGNKTEISPCVYDYPPADKEEIRVLFPWLVSVDVEYLNDSRLVQIKRYFAKMLQEKNTSQIKSILTWLIKKADNDKLVFNDTEDEFFLYMIQLSQTNTLLASKVYKVINVVISRTVNKERYLNKLMEMCDDVDMKFSNTILQIWHYYVLSQHSDKKKIGSLIKRSETAKYNPIILSEFVISKEKSNRALFEHIKNSYFESSGNNNWKTEIMNSKYWLPLFVIRLKDGYNYENWFHSAHYPDVLKNFQKKPF